MGNDLEIIKQIEKQVGKILEQMAIEDVMLKIYSGYATDQDENVIGLNLYNTKISDISLLTDLPYLTHLKLIYNQITDISPLKELPNLKRLDIDNNQITDISPLKELKALTILELSNNQITDISPLKELNALTELYLIDNQITELPQELLQLGMEINWKYRDGCGIFLEGNPLEIPPFEIVKQGTEAVRNYFKELEKEPVRLLQSKLLIVGNGEVGKTTLMKKLLDNNFKVEVGKEPTTHGIKINPWEMNCYFDTDIGLELEKVKLHFWDFGGQEIYHATHQFFLTKRSLYLLVWEARKEEESRSFDYWLNIIKLSSDTPMGWCGILLLYILKPRIF
jgi:internalin A